MRGITRVYIEKSKCNECCPNCNQTGKSIEGFRMPGKRVVVQYKIDSKGYIQEWICPECGWRYEPSWKYSKNLTKRERTIIYKESAESPATLLKDRLTEEAVLRWSQR